MGCESPIERRSLCGFLANGRMHSADRRRRPATLRDDRRAQLFDVVAIDRRPPALLTPVAAWSRLRFCGFGILSRINATILAALAFGARIGGIIDAHALFAEARRQSIGRVSATASLYLTLQSGPAVFGQDQSCGARSSMAANGAARLLSFDFGSGSAIATARCSA